MTFDRKLVNKGQHTSRRGLLDQASYHGALEKKHHGALLAAGWRAEDLAAFNDAVAVLESQMAATVEARADARGKTRDEQASIDDAKALKRRLVRAFHLLHQDGLVRDGDLQLVERSGSLRRSTAAIVEYLTLVGGTVALHDDKLRPYFGGASALERLDAVKAQLDAIQGVQETTLAALPQETLRVYEAKGRLLGLIERINHIGKIAFDGSAHLIAEFNKDLLGRARKRRGVDEAAEAAEEEQAG